MGTRSRTCCLALLATLSFARPAAAQQKTDAPTAAELFRQGREALADKNYALACPKFEESVRIDPHVGPMISLAECEEGLNHLARARTYWREAVDLAESLGDVRQAIAKERLDQIDRRVPRLTLHAVPDAPHGMVVHKDDVEVGAVSLDTPIPVEVGPHTVTVSAPGFAESAVTVVLAEGDVKEVGLELGSALPPTPIAAAEPPRRAEIPAPVPRKSAWMRPAAWIAGGTGVVAVGVASYFGVRAVQAKSDSPTDPARNFARTEGDASTGLFIAGGTLVAASVALWVLAPSSHAKPAAGRVVPRFGPGWFAVEGSF